MQGARRVKTEIDRVHLELLKLLNERTNLVMRSVI